MIQHHPIDRFTPYYLGNEIIDNEHRAIYDALVLLRNTTPPDLIPENITDALNKCNAHFHHEHQLMIKYKYPFIESHAAVHAYTEKRFLDVIEHPTHETLDLLINDLLHHIDWYDRPFTQFIFAEQGRERLNQK